MIRWIEKGKQIEISGNKRHKITARLVDNGKSRSYCEGCDLYWYCERVNNICLALDIFDPSSIFKREERL